MLTANGDTKVAIKIIDTKRAPDTFVNKFLPRELDLAKKLKLPGHKMM